MDPEISVDVACCALRSFRTGEESMIPGRSFKCYYIENYVNVEFKDGPVQIYQSVDNALQELPKALASADYRKVISLGPALLLIKELISRIPAVFLPVLCSIKHFERYKRGLNDAWCCKLHESIASHFYETTFQHIYNIKDDILFRTCTELYGPRASLSTRQKMFKRLCDSKILTLEAARALVTRDFRDKSSKHSFCHFLDRLDPKISLFLAIKLRSSISERVLKYADLKNKWWWMHYLYCLPEIYYRHNDVFTSFLQATITHGGTERVTIRFYRGLLKRFLECPKAFWPYLLPKFIKPMERAGEVEPFDPILAEVLYCSDDAKQIFKVVCGKNSLQLLPFMNFPKEYIKFGLQKGFLCNIVKYDAFEEAALKSLKEVVQIFMSAKIDNLNELLDFKIMDVFVSRAIAADDFNLVNWIKHPYELSLGDWREVALKSDYVYTLTNKEYVKYLFSVLQILPEESLNLHVNLFFNSNTEQYVKEYICQVFDPEKSLEFRVLFLHPSRTSLIKTIISDKDILELACYSKTCDRDLPEKISSLHSCNHYYDIDRLCGSPLGALLHRNEFWCGTLCHIFHSFGSHKSRREFCEKASNNFLIFLREVLLKLMECWQLQKIGKSSEAERNFCSFILNCEL